jgi:hypothetical protein
MDSSDEESVDFVCESDIEESVAEARAALYARRELPLEISAQLASLLSCLRLIVSRRHWIEVQPDAASRIYRVGSAIDCYCSSIRQTAMRAALFVDLPVFEYPAIFHQGVLYSFAGEERVCARALKERCIVYAACAMDFNEAVQRIQS